MWTFSRYYGNCFVFNSGFNASGHRVPTKSSLLSGYAYGLQLQMYIGFNHNLMPLNSLYGKGGMLKIENGSTFNDEKLEGVFVSPGLSPAVSIERNLNAYMPKPYSNCDVENRYRGGGTTNFNSDLFKLIYHSKYEYSQQLCFNQCIKFRHFILIRVYNVI